jgi:hypothetical protein
MPVIHIYELADVSKFKLITIIILSFDTVEDSRGWTVTVTYYCRPLTCLNKLNIHHFQFCRFGQSLNGIKLYIVISFVKYNNSNIMLFQLSFDQFSKEEDFQTIYLHDTL